MIRRKNRRSRKKKLVRKFGSNKVKDDFPNLLTKFITKNKDDITKTVNILNPSESVKSMTVSEKLIHWFVGTGLGKWTVSKITEKLMEDERSRAKIIHLGMDYMSGKTD